MSYHSDPSSPKEPHQPIDASLSESLSTLLLSRAGAQQAGQSLPEKCSQTQHYVGI